MAAIVQLSPLPLLVICPGIEFRVRCLYFHPEGECVFSGTADTLRVCGWEPVRTLDSLCLGWGRVADIATASQQLIGASHHASHVQLWVIDLKKVQPFGGVAVPEKDTGKVTFRDHPVRRSFIKEKPEPGKRPVQQVKISEECSDKSGTDGDDSDAVSTAEIPNITNYEHIFGPRQRQLNRTPPIEPPFEAPAEPAMPQPVRASDPMNFHSSRARPSPGGTRRASQPTLPSGYTPGPSGPAGRRGSAAGLPGGEEGRMRPQEVHMRPHSTAQPRPASQYDAPGSPVRAGYRTALNLAAISQQATPEDAVFLPQRPHSSLPGLQIPASPSKTHHPSSTAREAPPPYAPELSPGPPSPTKGGPSPYSRPGAPLDRPTPVRRSQQEPAQSYQQLEARPAKGEEDPDTVKLVPSMSDKPTGLTAEDFLPNQFGKLSVAASPFGWPQTELSESEVTSSILKGHSNMMAVLTTRSRNIDIVRQMWHSKDAKTAAEQAVEFNDHSIIVDLLSVIVLRPSIWSLDLCNILIPPIGELLLSKYESYVNSSAAALKLILKNFATVIKSNIDSPGSAVGVDISKEERANKCMDCYRELVKIRSGILKRQTMQGKAGHAYRELAILMQYLD